MESAAPDTDDQRRRWDSSPWQSAFRVGRRLQVRFCQSRLSLKASGAVMPNLARTSHEWFGHRVSHRRQAQLSGFVLYRPSESAHSRRARPRQTTCALCAACLSASCPFWSGGPASPTARVLPQHRYFERPAVPPHSRRETQAGRLCSPA